MSCRHDGHAAELPGDPAADMSCRHHGHTAKLPGATGDSAAAAVRAAEEGQPSGAMRVTFY